MYSDERGTINDERLTKYVFLSMNAICLYV